jgi:DNA invertase Pin-like site-specific DNA recombinase
MRRKQTALYLRVSTHEQSTAAQRAELDAYCAARCWTDAVVYDDVITGSSTSRPQFDLMLNHARAGKLARILVVKLDRLGRSLAHVAMTIAELQCANVALICTSQGIDTSTDNPAGRFQVAVLAAVAEFERSLISERTREGLRAVRARGGRLGRPRTNSKAADQARALSGQGCSNREVGRRLGVSHPTVKSLLSGKTGPNPENAH